MTNRLLNGHVALVTGGTRGIGFHTAVGLATLGARVVVTGRDEKRGQQAIADLQRLAGGGDVELMIADASSVRAHITLAQAISARVSRLDILVNNAGGAAFPHRLETVEGFEANLALNFVGPFALTTRLLPLLTETRAARVVNVVSSAFSMWRYDPFDDLEARRHYVAIENHARAKLLNLLFTFALVRRLDGTGVAANAVNPGMAWTPGIAALTPEAVPRWRLIWPVVRWFQRRASAEVAAQAPLFLASSPAMANRTGRYFDGPREKPMPARLLDAALQERVWALGESLVAGALGGAAAAEKIS